MSVFEDKRSRPHFDFLLLINMYLLMFMGVLAIAVAAYNPAVSEGLPLINRILASDSGSWQAIFVVASPAAVWFIVSIPYEHFKAFAPVYFLGTIILLLVVLVTTSAIRGVQAWLRISSLDRMLQPSEFVKITLILMLAKELSITEKPMGDLRSVLRIGTFAAVPALLTFASGETGSVIIMFGITYLMLYFGGVSWKWMLAITALIVLGLAGILAYGLIGGSTHFRMMRILAFIDPYAYPKGAGMQLINSQKAIGSGGMTGVGLFVPGSMSQLDFVPEGVTDFVFATIGEAVGFVGSATIVVLFVILVLRMLYLSRFTYDKFGRLVIIGVMSMIFLHIFQNIAMTIGLMPITGIPLPFLSYGGSNLLTNVVGVSLVLNVTRNRTAAMPSYNVPAGQVLRSRRRRRRTPVYVNTAGPRGLRRLSGNRRRGRAEATAE